MNFNFLLFVLSPMAVGAGVGLASIYCIVGRPSALQIVAALVVLPGVFWSEWVLGRIALGAWPTFLPHIVITLLVPVVIMQMWRASKRLPPRGFPVVTHSDSTSG